MVEPQDNIGATDRAREGALAGRKTSTQNWFDTTVTGTINVRCLDLAEYPRGWNLYQSAVLAEQELPFRDAPSEVKMEAAVAFNWHRDGLFLGCFRNFWMIGVARLERRSPIMLAHKSTLELLWLLPEHRGRGYGKMFLKGILTEAKQKGIERLQARVDVSQSAKIFQAVGFQPCGIEICAKKINQRCVDQNILEIDLTA